MILQALYRLSQADDLIGDPDFEFQEVSWVVRLREDGALLAIEDHRVNVEAKPNRKARLRGQIELVPKQFYRSGTQAPPFFLVDNAKYVFGLATKNTRFPREEGVEKAKSFRELAGKCANATGEADVLAICSFFDLYEPASELLPLPSDCVGNDLFAFRVGTREFAHLRPKVRSWWKAWREAPKGDGADFRCAITGEPISEVPTFDEIESPAGGKPIKLVSFSQPAFCSYGLKANQNYAVSRDAGEAVARAVNRLLSRNPQNSRGERLPVRHVRLSPDTVALYWSFHRGVQDDLSFVTDLNSRQALKVFASTDRPEPLVTRDNERATTTLYSLTISGMKGRAIVRDWHEASIASMSEKINRYFFDLRIVAADEIGIGQVPTLSDLLELLRGKQGSIRGEGSTSLWRTATQGASLPRSLALTALAEVRRAAVRGDFQYQAAIGLLKLWVCRRGDAAIGCYLNEDHPSASYQCGRIMGVLSEVHLASANSGAAGLLQQYYAAASIRPAAVLKDVIRRIAPAQLSAIRHPKSRQRYADHLASATSRVPGAWPETLSPEEQALFALGFYQQRAYERGHFAARYRVRTDRGDWVRSLGERDLANALHQLGFPYIYRPKHESLPTGDHWHGFLVPNSVPSHRIFIEYHGGIKTAPSEEDRHDRLLHFRRVGILPIEDGGGSRGRLIVIAPPYKEGRRKDALKIRLKALLLEPK